MATFDDGLDELGWQLRRRVPPGRPVRAALEERLTPMIRLALRRGLGPVPLVRFVGRRAAIGSDQPHLAEPLARELSARLLLAPDPAPCRETVVGP